MLEAAAVLTGDLIGSTAAPPSALEASMTAIDAAARRIAGWSPDGDARFTRFRGDGWQLIVEKPAMALRAMLVLVAELRAADTGLATRTTVGIGRVDSVGTVSLADARGSAFETSGRALDALGRGRRLYIAGAGITDLHGVVVDLLDEWSRHWTADQAEAAALYLGPDSPTLADIAGRLGITPQAVADRLARGGGPAIRRTLRVWEEGWPGDGAGA